ncbi:MAG: sigma-70 family RNA polymerase sigma factor [Patescibacteria group bacterium]|jgi:RNA polymerase sigma-70 factor (ECF subfamily)|nr:sigma-70 family RNA polymerase sigma factor [Patescibacteria group bacterium]
MKQTDEEIAGKIQSGDKEAFGEVIDRYEKPLCSFIFRILGDRDNCADALQETFLKAYKNINSFDPKRKFSSWIYRIAHNEAITHYRKNTKHVALDDVVEIASDDNHADFIQKELDSEGQKMLLDKALLTIPLKYREVIVFRFYEDKSYEEISEIMHLPVNTVGTYLNRGKIELKKHFKDINIEDIL